MRLFVAIPIPAAQRAALRALQQRLPFGRAMAEETLHITLAFLDEVPRTRLDDLDEALGEVSAAPFAVTLAGTGTFGTPPRVIWAGVAPQPALDDLARRVRGAARRAGVVRGHEKFRPHVTLRRLRPGEATDAALARALEETARWRTDPFPVEGFTLFRSELGAGGARHTPLAEYPLG